MYKLTIKKSALKELREIPRNFRIQIVEKIDALVSNPRPSGTKKLENSQNNYRVRIGDYRVVYRIEDSELIIEVIKIAHRKEVYRNK